MSVVPLPSIFCLRIKKLNLKFLLSPWTLSYGQAPSYIRVTAAQTLLAVAVPYSFDLKIKVTWPHAFEILLLTDQYLKGNTCYCFFFTDCITYSAHITKLDSFAMKLQIWKHNTKHCSNKCQWQIIFKTIKFFVDLLYFIPFKKDKKILLFCCAIFVHILQQFKITTLTNHC